MANILSIAKSGLAAAQLGMNTTGHNIANQATPGYSRQLVIQTSAGAVDQGNGFVGNGTSIQTVQRVYNEFIGSQIRASQSSTSQLTTHYNQINKINNMIADASVGLSPVMQGFFAGIQDLTASPTQTPSRQAMLSSAEALAARFQSLSGQLRDMNESINSEITASVTSINAYAKQIAQLNDAIARAQSSTGREPNDLLDQRDLLVAELSKQTKVTVVEQETGYGLFIGNGQPLVVGPNVQELVTMPSSTDAGRLQVGYAIHGGNVLIPDVSLTGGNLGGLFEYRSKTLDQVQNALGRVAIGLASTFNAQHRLGQDQNGNAGLDFFNVAQPFVGAGAGNSATASVTATLSNVDDLTTNDYRLSYDGSAYKVTRLPDNVSVYAGPTFPTGDIDGFTLTEAGAMAAGDEFMIRPTAYGALNFSVLIKDTKLIAAAAPITTQAPSSNSGTGSINAGSINAGFTAGTISGGVTLAYDSATNTFSGFPAGMPVTVNGTAYPADTPVPYTAGATIEFGGVEIQISGVPSNGDTFSIGANPNGAGDSRNMLLLGALQTKNVLQGGTASYNSAYAQIVSLVGNKTRELQVNSAADGALLKQLQLTQQSDSGVNLDEEATNLLRYQQAYQASGRVMQAASDMFDVLISLGR